MMSYTDRYLTRSRATSVSLRPAHPGDREQLIRVAQRDAAPLPAEPLVVADLDGEIRAAISLADGTVIADPFHPTAAIVAMLREHAEALAAPRAAPAPQRRRRLRLAFRSAS